MSAQPLIAIYSNSKMLDKIVSFSVHSIVVLFRSTFSYRNYLSGRTKISARLLNLFYDVDTIRDLSEHAVLPIKPWCFAGANKELATICVGAFPKRFVNTGHKRMVYENTNGEAS
mmetsp:Transcript_15872/g.35740  ORF Transcript_15872/g.35740 Transcript_15872/m.35740 type:complete len:115 (-) Transcript_15872:28-372(-)